MWHVHQPVGRSLLASCIRSGYSSGTRTKHSCGDTVPAPSPRCLFLRTGSRRPSVYPARPAGKAGWFCRCPMHPESHTPCRVQIPNPALQICSDRKNSSRLNPLSPVPAYASPPFCLARYELRSVRISFGFFRMIEIDASSTAIEMTIAAPISTKAACIGLI